MKNQKTLTPMMGDFFDWISDVPQEEVEIVQSATQHAMRVVSPYESVKLTNASQQFLMRVHKMGLIDSEHRELILNRLANSDSRYVGLQETKWMIRKTLAHGLDNEQMAFLDLVLYQKEDGLMTH